MTGKRYDAKRIALSAVFVALMLVILYLSSFFPVMSLTLIAIAGILPAVLVEEYGVGTAALCYAGAAILALLLVPDRMNALLFVLLFGHYPIVKNLSERVKYKWITWAVKLAVANLLFWIIWFLFRFLFMEMVTEMLAWVWLLWIAFNVIFVLYDICLTKLMLLYRVRFSKRMR